jgi:hypothetical protein
MHLAGGGREGARKKSIRFAMACPELDAIVIGFNCSCEIDEAIKRMNSALAA